jgi:hypothetical protein
MSLSPQHRAKLLASTREQATALFDDLHYLRDIAASRIQSAPEIRRASSVLRRLLVERDIASVAAPRIGRFMFSMPDNRIFYKAANEVSFTFFASGDTEVFGVKFRHAIVDLNYPQAGRRHLGMVIPQRMRTRLDGFMSQRVLCLNGQWVTRADVIKHVANVASGVHSGIATTLADETISRIRRSVWYTKSRDSVKITCDMAALELRSEPLFTYSPERIDPALLELLATITQILASEDTERLEHIIKQELS